MNFGAELDDDLFEITKCKKTEEFNTYSAKICSSKWFQQYSDAEAKEDYAAQLKFDADYLYFHHQYSDAIKKYEECLEALQVSNVTGKRDCLEGIIHSLLHQGSLEEALAHALQLHAMSSNVDQKIVAWSSLATIYHQLGKYANELKTLQNCLNYHPWNYDFWLRISFCYAKIFGVELDVESEHKLLKTAIQLKSDKAENQQNEAEVHNLCNEHCSLTSTKETDISSLSDDFNEITFDPMENKSCQLSQQCEEKSRNECIHRKLANSVSENLINEKGPMIVCACFIRAKVLLQTCILGYRSFAYKNNLHHQEQITSIVKQMNIDGKFVDYATEIYLRDIGIGMLEDDDTLTDDKPGRNAVEKVMTAQEQSEMSKCRQFEMRWFGWIFKM